MPPASPLRSRDAGRVVSKSDTKDASRSSGLQRNRGIMRFRFARFTPAEPFVSDLDIGPALEDCLATARRRIPMHTPTKPGSDIRHLSRGWRVRPQAPSCVAQSGTFRAAGCGLLRVGAFDAAGDRNPVPRRVRCPWWEGKVPGRAGCPRQRPGMGATRTSGGPHASWARRERDDIAPARGARLLTPTASKENLWPTAPPPPSL